MKKFMFRVLAFILDSLIASIIILGVSSISLFNPNQDELNLKYKEFYNNQDIYNGLNKKIDSYFEDKMLSEEELEEISIIYSEYIKCFDGIDVDLEIDESTITSVKDKVNDLNLEISNNLAIKINKLYIPTTIISFVVYILYFGVLQYFLNGQTPFKRIFRIKVVSVNDKKVSLLNYIVRAILVTEVLLSTFDIIALVTLNNAGYINASYFISQAKYIYEIVFLVCLIIRSDGRSIDDLILKTKVIRYDKDGNEVIDPIFKEVDADNA